MPIHEILCKDCGFDGETISLKAEAVLACPSCGSESVEKLLSVTSNRTGHAPQAMPGPGDTACCGTSPGHAGCAGPGSCCGKI